MPAMLELVVGAMPSRTDSRPPLDPAAASAASASASTAAAISDAADDPSELRPLLAATLAAFSAAALCGPIEAILEFSLPRLAPTAPLVSQLGAALVLRALVLDLGTRVLPYAALLIAPLVSCLSSMEPQVRDVGGQAFAALMPLLPLEPDAAEPDEMSAAWRARKAAERPFIGQLLGLEGAAPPPYVEIAASIVSRRGVTYDGGHSSHRYELPVKLNATLRPYQQEGVNWLAFLRRFGLHGILCDDMGLGKTIQTLALLSSAAHEQRELAARAQADGERPPPPLPSLVVCPTTLTGHWAAEASKFCAASLSVFEYVTRSQFTYDLGEVHL